MKMPNAQQLVTIALLVHDLSWITLHPETGIPAMLLGVGIQLYLTVSSFGAHRAEFVCQASLLFWLIGNVIWTCAEFIYDQGHPVGFLAHVSFVNHLSATRSYYGVMMFTAITIQTTVCLGLIAFYISHWARWRQQRSRTILPLANPAEPLVGRPAQTTAALTGFAAPLSPAEAYVLLPWLPLRMYYELFTLPWILMDTLWSYFNLLDILKTHPGISCMACSLFFGVAAIAICLDCVRRLRAAGQRSEAALAMAEAFWVTGNVFWMLEDSVTSLHMKWMKLTAISLFALGPCLVICSMFLTDRENVEDGACSRSSISTALPANAVTTSESSLEAGSFLEGHVPIVTSQQEKRATAEVMVPDAIKKKHNSSRPRKTPRLMKRVTVLPKGSSDQSNFAQLVARLALNSLGEHGNSIALLDLGNISKRLLEWRQCLPRVHLHFSLRSHADKKILQLLSQERCGFTCATAEEVSRLLSLGVSPQDVMFCEVHKLKSHLSYVKEKGVQLMPFVDAAELRKIAAEYPAARLLLQLAPPKRLSSSPVQFGASREEWPQLLALASELGLEVMGVSLRGGPGCEQWGLPEDALKDAHEVFSLAKDGGNAMEVLDLGSIDFSRQGVFEEVAATIEEQLSRWFPVEDYSTLRILASPGQLFTRTASMLLTQVIAKDFGAPGGEESGGSPHLKYVLNAGLYGAFASILTDRREPDPPVAISFGAHDRPAQRCCFLGPSQEKMDVVLKEATIPELEEGEWILWPGMGAPTRSLTPEDVGQELQQTQVWYYTEAGNLPGDIHP